jgi:hypothetical protein
MKAALARVHHPQDRTFGEIKWIAIALSEPDPAIDQRHLGVLYRDGAAPEQVMLLHLAWHHNVRREERLKPECVWIEPDVEPEQKQVLTQVCTVVADKYAKKRRSIKYALRYTDGRFDPANGEFLTEEGTGLTCATFVLALFASYGVSLVQAEEWLTERSEERAKSDKDWQEHVLTKLREYRASRRNPEDVAELDAHIAVVEADNSPCARFRPEEVAAAGTSPDLPVGFAYADPVGRAIVDKLRAAAR